MANLNDAKVQVSQLKAALQQVQSVRSQLGRNAQEVKCQIQTVISRQLEALRNREVWLLNQVDLIQSAKEEVLQQQQNRLSETLGAAQRTLELGAVASANDGSCITKSEKGLNFDLKPEENPHITFQADSLLLREAILKYGRVETNGFSIHGSAPFDELSTPSSCLPKPFEEYEDADHHVLYKTLADVNRAKAVPDTSVSVTIPKLTVLSDDWLAIPCISSRSASPTETSPSLSIPNLSMNINDWLVPRVSSPVKTSPVDSKMNLEVLDDSSLQTWLHQIKRSPIMEDDDEFEVVDHSSLTNVDQITMHLPGSPLPMPAACKMEQNEKFTPLVESPTASHCAMIEDMDKADIEKWLSPQKKQPVITQVTLDDESANTRKSDSNEADHQSFVTTHVPSLQLLCENNTKLSGTECKPSVDCTVICEPSLRCTGMSCSRCPGQCMGSCNKHTGKCNLHKWLLYTPCPYDNDADDGMGNKDDVILKQMRNILEKDQKFWLARIPGDTATETTTLPAYKIDLKKHCSCNDLHYWLQQANCDLGQQSCHENLVAPYKDSCLMDWVQKSSLTAADESNPEVEIRQALDRLYEQFKMNADTGWLLKCSSDNQCPSKDGMRLPSECASSVVQSVDCPAVTSDGVCGDGMERQGYDEQALLQHFCSVLQSDNQQWLAHEAISTCI